MGGWGGGGDESLVEKNKNLVGGSLLDGGIFLIEGDGNFSKGIPLNPPTRESPSAPRKFSQT